MHALDVMKSEGFLSLSQTALSELIARDSFYADEFEIFYGVRRWMNHNCVEKESAKELLDGIRLQLIPQSSLLADIRHCDMFDSNKILDALSVIDQKSVMDLRHRGLLSKLHLSSSRFVFVCEERLAMSCGSQLRTLILQM